MLANNIYRRTKVKNNEILELLIYSAYIEEQAKLEEHELSLFKEDVEYYYNEGINEVREAKKKKKKWSAIPNVLFLYLLAETNALGYTWQKQAEQTALNNANQLYRQATISLMQQKPLKMDSDEFKTILNNQLKQKVNINGDKISGSIDLQLIGMNNRAKVEGIKKEDKDAKARFLAVTDSHSTDVCQSLKDQTFYIDKENEFYRMYGETPNELRNMRIKCKGLILGLNLPPIRHNFHWCRSSITYINKDSYYYSAKYLVKNTFPYRDVLSKAKKYGKEHEGKVTINNYYDYEGERYTKEGEIKQDHNDREKEVANVIAKDLGADVELVPRFIKEDDVRTNDIKINKEDWEIKTIEENGKNTIDKAIREGKGQAINFVLDIVNKEVTYDELINHVTKLYKSYDRHWVKNLMIVRDGKVIGYFMRN